MSLSEQCLDDWLADKGAFRLALLEFSWPLSKVLGYSFEFDQAAIETAHLNWHARCQLWQQERVSQTSTKLSHIKIMSLLLFSLASVKWIRRVHEFDNSGDGRDAPSYNGTDAEREEARKDFNAARGTYLAFQFVIGVINWFEKYRKDRQQPFEFRLTTDLEHDLMVYLLSETRDELALYLMLKALYTRDPTDDANGH